MTSDKECDVTRVVPPQYQKSFTNYHPTYGQYHFIAYEQVHTCYFYLLKAKYPAVYLSRPWSISQDVIILVYFCR